MLSGLFFLMLSRPHFVFFFFFNDPATPEIYPFSLHDVLPISSLQPREEKGRFSHSWSTLERDDEETSTSRRTHIAARFSEARRRTSGRRAQPIDPPAADRKSTRLNSSHSQISYAVFCLKKKNI